MSLALNEAQFQQFIQYHDCVFIIEAASYIGVHIKRSVWVLMENLQLEEVMPIARTPTSGKLQLIGDNMLYK